jgi:hypothetical protein
VPALALAQAVQHNPTLIVNGQPGVATVVQINGRSYVDIEGLARIASGSLDFKGNQIILTLPAPTAGTVPAAKPANKGFSREFLRAGFEEMAAIREWRSVLADAVQHRYPVTQEWLSWLSCSSCQEPRSGVCGSVNRF